MLPNEKSHDIICEHSARDTRKTQESQQWRIGETVNSHAFHACIHGFESRTSHQVNKSSALSAFFIFIIYQQKKKIPNLKGSFCINYYLICNIPLDMLSMGELLIDHM